MPAAIDNNEFLLNFQPIAKLACLDQPIENDEALIRWQHPDKGIFPSVEFINIAEDSRDIVKLGYWVIRQVCMYLAQPSVSEIISISMNLSPVQLQEPFFVDKVTSLVEYYKIDPQRIVLEITENTAMLNSELNKEIFAKFHAAGFKLSMDDFGTGYTSLSYLMNFSFDVLKVDKSFIDNALVDKSYITIGHTIVKLAHELFLIVVPERLESSRLIVRQFRESDWSELHQYYSDALATKYTFGRALTVGDSWRTMCGMIGHWQVRGYDPYAVEDKAGGHVVGTVGFWYPVDWPEPEIKWGLARKYCGKGFAKEAAALVPGAGKEHLSDYNLISLIHPDNKSSIGVAMAMAIAPVYNIAFVNQSRRNCSVIARRRGVHVSGLRRH